MEQGFEQEVVSLLRRAGVVTTDTDEACVVVFDSRCWGDHVTGAQALLDAHERARAARLRFRRHRETYVLAHALWRIALGFCLDQPASTVPISRAAAGRPLLPGTGLATSLSHSGSWVAVAMAAAATVGVDIEAEQAGLDTQALSATIATAEEIRQWQALPAAAREPALLALWTRKEALLKAFGVGLAEAPATQAATGAELYPPPASAPDMPACRVAGLDLPHGLVGAWAAPASVLRCRLHVLHTRYSPGGEHHARTLSSAS